MQCSGERGYCARVISSIWVLFPGGANLFGSIRLFLNVYCLCSQKYFDSQDEKQKKKRSSEQMIENLAAQKSDREMRHS